MSAAWATACPDLPSGEGHRGYTNDTPAQHRTLMPRRTLGAGPNRSPGGIPQPSYRIRTRARAPFPRSHSPRTFHPVPHPGLYPILGTSRGSLLTNVFRLTNSSAPSTSPGFSGPTRSTVSTCSPAAPTTHPRSDLLRPALDSRWRSVRRRLRFRKVVGNRRPVCSHGNVRGGAQERPAMDHASVNDTRRIATNGPPATGDGKTKINWRSGADVLSQRGLTILDPEQS